jgi:aldehyde:ferredoxin oxidoreductase
MANAFMGKILRVDLNQGTTTAEPIRMDWARQFLGGVGLATRYYYEQVPAGVDPLGPQNNLIFMTGPLTGTASASASRYSVVAKSPQTGMWGQANSGGTFGPALKRSGYDGVIFEGIAESPVYLWVENGKAELRDASHLWGKNVPETDDLLQAESKQAVKVACIGPAGENLVRYAAIMNEKHRAAGRCGMGAVMGAKRVKAIACAGNENIELAQPERFNQVTRQQLEYMDESLLKVGFDTFGTNMVADMVNVRGGYPTRNWQQGEYEQLEEINAQAITDKILIEGVRCFACPVACGRSTEIRDGKWKGHSGEGPEYETANMLGAQCDVDDLNAITMANYRCNEYGLDTISTGATIAFSLECYERGILDEGQTGGVALKFGDADLIVELVDKIAYREGVGDLLAEGTRVMAERLGQGAEHFAMQVKGMELPAYDPRAAKITGLGYVTASRGGDHITGYIQLPTFFDMPFLIIEDSFISDPFEANPEEVHVLVDLENALTVLDAIGGCKFMGILLTAEDLTGLIASATGWDFDVQDFRKTGERIYNLTRVCCVREGMGREQDVLPGRLMSDPLPSGPAEGMVIDQETMEVMKDAYYAARGWDTRSGIPSAEKLRELALEPVADDLWV